MDCEKCGKEHDGSYGRGRFCCSKCSHSFSSRKLIKTTKKMKCTYCNNVLDVDIRTSRVSCDKCKRTLHKKTCPTCGEIYKTSRLHQTFCSTSCGNNFPENLENNRHRAQKREFGGHTSKKSVVYECKDGSSVYLQSSYEHSVAADLDKNDILWTRPEPLKWVDSDEIYHRYYPDFYLVDYDIYLDPKNDYLIKKDDYKIRSVCEQNNVCVLMLNKDQLCWDEIKLKIDTRVT